MVKKNPDKMTKDDRHHDKVKIFVERAMQLIMMIVDYEIESSGKGKWIGMIDLANEAIKRVEGWQVLIKSAEALQKEKEELQSFGKDVLQQMAILNQKGQSISEARSEARSEIMAYENFLKKTENFFSNITKNDNLNQGCAHQVEGHHGVDTGGEQLTLESAQIPPSSQINEKGKDVEAHDQEGSQNSADDIFAEILKDIPLPECGGHLESLLKKNMTGKSARWDEGTSNAPASEASAKRSADETCILLSNKNNANLLTEIFAEHPNIINNLKFSSPKLLDYFMNELAQIHQKIIKGNPEMLKLDGIIDMEKMVRDMERDGLQVTWLREKLEESRERLENQETKNKLLERINNCKAETEETEQEQAQSAKKRRHK